MEELPICENSEFCPSVQSVMLDESSVPNMTSHQQMPSHRGFEKQYQVFSEDHGDISVTNNAQSFVSSSVSERSTFTNPTSTSDNRTASQQLIVTQSGFQMPRQLKSSGRENLPQNQGSSMDLTYRKEPWPKVITMEPHQFSVSQKSNSTQNKYHKPPPHGVEFINVSFPKAAMKNKRVAEYVAPPPQKVTSEPFESVRSKMRESLASAFELVCNKQTVTKTEESQVGGSNPTSNGKLNIDLHGSTLGVDTGSKDDLLVQNGLSWSSHLIDVKSTELQDDVANEVASKNTPKALAKQIEAELFNLFDGVNKKYRERGRSLLFNLRDQHNPELRKRVFFGEIAPERLCSMTAAELASKELSDWRIAKADKFEQMVVLPDSEVDLKCLVKKTHKGEIQVGVERDDGVSFDELSSCSGFQSHSLLESKKYRPPLLGSLSSKIEQIRSKYKGSESSVATTVLKVPSKDNIPEKSNGEYNTLNPLLHDHTDLMQDLILDGSRDTESLPPVPSLDEFMQELDLQPPFQNLPIDVVQSGTENNLLDVNTIKSESRPESPIAEMDTQSRDVSDDSDLNPTGSWSPIMTTMSPVANFSYLDTKIPSQNKPIVNVIKHEPVWDGLIQLNTSSLVTALGFYKSGERLSVNAWPGFLEIKGQVRLNAFEKLLQELDLSHSRSHVVMVLHFVWKKGTSESGHIKLSQTIDAYIKDDLVGFAAPITSDVELYFCSPHPKHCHMLMTNLPTEHRASLVSINTGLIGIVFLRKTISTKTSTIFPKTPYTNPNPNPKQNPVNKKRPVFLNGAESDNEEDDVPPGFGIDNNLPKFVSVQNGATINTNAVSNAVPPCVEPSSLDRLRQLVQMYGKTETKNEISIPNADSDDGMHEWQPNRKFKYHHHRVLKRQRTQPPMPQAGHYDHPMPSHQFDRGFKRGGNWRGKGRGRGRRAYTR